MTGSNHAFSVIAALAVLTGCTRATHDESELPAQGTEATNAQSVQKEPELQNSAGKPSEADMTEVEPVTLPSNWRELTNEEKFSSLRDSPSLIRGDILSNVEIDCRKGKITDLNAQFALKYNPPTREAGSYSFVNAHDTFVTGSLEILSSNEQGLQLIYILREGLVSQNGRGVPYVFRQDELSRLAKLFETKANHCSAAGGTNIKAYVILAKREL